MARKQQKLESCSPLTPIAPLRSALCQASRALCQASCALLMCWLQNGLGIVLAGGLGGTLYLQKKEKVQVEEKLSEQLSSERSTVGELKSKVNTHPCKCCFRIQAMLCETWQHCMQLCSALLCSAPSRLSCLLLTCCQVVFWQCYVCIL